MILSITLKVTKCNLRYFEYTQSMSKWPTGSVYIDNIASYLICLPAPFLKGQEENLEGSSPFSQLTPSKHINRLSLANRLY